MSTDPTTIATTLATEPTMVTDPTAATEAGFSIDTIKELMDAFDPAALLPDLSQVFGSIETVCRIAVLVGPIVLLVMGIAYLFFSPKEANYYFGYRCYYGMGSVQAWRFTQRMAGIVLGGLGLVLTAVMLFISSGFAGMEAMDVVWKAVSCLVWEAVLALAANIAISVTAAMKFDRKGEYRNKSAK